MFRRMLTFLVCLLIISLSYLIFSVQKTEASHNLPPYDGEASLTGQVAADSNVDDLYFNVLINDFHNYQAFKVRFNLHVDKTFGNNPNVVLEACLTENGWINGSFGGGNVAECQTPVSRKVIENETISDNFEMNLGNLVDLNYASFHIRVDHVYTTSDFFSEGRRVYINSFCANGSCHPNNGSAKAGDNISLSWGTENNANNTTLIWSGCAGSGSSGVPKNSSGYGSFSCSGSGTASFILRACGPGGTLGGGNGICIETNLDVAVSPPPGPGPGDQPTGTIWPDFTTCTKSGSQKCDIVLNYATTNATQGNINQIFSNGPEVRYYDIPGDVLPAGTAPKKIDPAPGTYTYILYGSNAYFPSQELKRTQTITIIGEAPPPSGNFSLTVNRSGSGTVTGPGINCGTDCSENFGQGVSVVLTATPDNGWDFTNWSGCDSVNGGNCTVTMNANRIVTATFTALAGCQGNCARYVSQVPPPSQMTVGETRTVSITMENTGTTTWTCCSGSSDINFSDGYKLGTQNPQDNFIWGLARDAVSKTVSPGQQETFSFNVTAPSISGTYNFQWRMVQDIGKGWFGDFTPNVTVNVTSVPVDPGNITVNSPDTIATWTLLKNGAVLDTFTGTTKPYTGLNCNVSYDLQVQPKSGYQPPTVSPAGAHTLACGESFTWTINFNPTPPPGTGSVAINIYKNGVACNDCVHFTTFPNGTTNGWTGPHTWTLAPTGTYSISAPDISGFSKSITPPTSQTLGGDQTITFNINYSTTPTCQDTGATNYGGSLPCTYLLIVTKSGSGSGTVTSSPSGIDCEPFCSSSYSSGTSVTLNAFKDSKSDFQGWSGDVSCTGTGSCAVIMDRRRNVTATFDKKNDPTVNLFVEKRGFGSGTVTGGSRINCGSICSASFNSGDMVGLDAVPNSGSTFAGWSGPCSGTGGCVFRINSNQTVIATFNVISAPTCQDTSASNFGGPLPCTYPPPGSVTASCTVNISPPTVSISANPTSVIYGQSSTLSWSSSSVGSCSKSGDWSGSATPNVSGSQSTGALAQIKRYTYALTCSGDGSVSGTAFVDVTAPPPSVSNITVTEPNYCVSGPAATIGWSYSDQLGSPQTAYQVQIDDQGSFQSPAVDSGKVNSGSNSFYSGQGSLQFNVTYRARVRAWNSFDVPSQWTTSSTWKTPNNAYPQVDFIWSPTNPPINSPVQLTDQTVFSGPSNGRNWSWVFGDGGSATQQNPSHAYGTEGSYLVTLTATDSSNQSCVRTKGPIFIQKPIPLWKEIAPR